MSVQKCRENSFVIACTSTEVRKGEIDPVLKEAPGHEVVSSA